MIDNSVLFVGQCKQGSNSLFSILEGQESLVRGHDIRAMVAADFNDAEYMSNWDDIDTSGARFLLDKSIINPLRYDYHVGDWRNYRHRMIYMLRNTYDVLRSQFLIVLAGEASYQYCIPRNAKRWNTEGDFTEADAIAVLEYNKQKIMHLENIKNLPKDVFDLSANVHFCTFEAFKKNIRSELDRLEAFLDMSITCSEYPHVNKTYYDWYAENTERYQHNLNLFERHKEALFDRFVKRDEYEELSEIVGIDLVELYGIK